MSWKAYKFEQRNIERAEAANFKEEKLEQKRLIEKKSYVEENRKLKFSEESQTETKKCTVKYLLVNVIFSFRLIYGE